jgi:hypothetical protein
LRSIAIQDYQDIATARKLLRSWPEIMEALWLPRDRWPGLARAWRKIGKDYGGNPPKIAAVASIPGAKAGKSRNLWARASTSTFDRRTQK